MNGTSIIASVLWTGTKETGRRLGCWLCASDLEGGQRAGGAVLRLMGASATVWFGGGMLYALDALPYVLPMAWFVPAAIFGGDRDEAPVDGGDAASRPSHEDVARALHALTGDKNGVHLSAVAARLEIEQPVLRELLDEMDVPHKSVKIKGVGVAVGVSKKDLPPSPPPLAESGSGQVAGSAAGQSATATATPFVIKQTEKGPEVWIDNPLNPAETHIFRALGKEAS